MKHLCYLIVLFPVIASAQQNEIQLYPGRPPGSENWTWTEGISNKNSAGVMTVYNVVRPSLTVFRPEAAVANGTAMIVAPGGGFHFLAIDHEGTNAAKLLAKSGITVFLLKYRLVHITGDNPFDDMIHAPDHAAWDRESDPIIPLAVADGRTAIAWVRSHATEYGILSDKIGFMGFSAGGRIAASTAFGSSKANRPDFVVAVYADMPESIRGRVTDESPPLFMVCAGDDEFGFNTHALEMYEKWHAAKRPVELHLFARGGHGFGIGTETTTTDRWLDSAMAWILHPGRR